MTTIPVVTIFVRHAADCKYRDDETYKQCKCRKHLRYFMNGKQRRVKAGTRSWVAAEAKKRELEDQLAGRPPQEGAEAVTLTLDKAVEVFSAKKKAEGISARVLARYDLLLTRLRTFSELHGHFTPARALTFENLIAFRGTWHADWQSSYTRKVMQFHLVHFLHTAHDAGWIAKVPRLSPIKADSPETLPLTDAEYKQLLKHATGKTRTVIQLMRWSGLAVRDASTLKRADVVKEGRNYKIIRKRTKTGTPLYIPIPPNVGKEVLSVMNGNPVYVSWTPRDAESSERMYALIMSQYIAKVFKAAGVESEGHMISHRLRATFAVDLLQKGVPLEHVSKLLGHTSVTTTEKHYAKWVKGRQVLLDNLVSATWKK